MPLGLPGGQPPVVSRRSPEVLARHAARERARRAANPSLVKEGHLRRMFGLTLEAYEALKTAQGGLCAICGRAEPGGKGDFHVDHDHSCCPRKTSCGNCIRGLLCARCNTAIALFGDDPSVMERAMAYVTR